MYPRFSWHCYMHLYLCVQYSIVCLCGAHSTLCTLTGFVTEFTVYITEINGTQNCENKNVSGLFLRSFNLANF